jgi:GntR family transcriptional regulator, carbon starvation induced regulator
MRANQRSGTSLRGSRLTAGAVAPKPPLTEQAYRTLRQSILRGTIVAGERLKIDVLQRDLDISSSPLREALNRLVAENLVIADERRGFRAAPVTRKDLTDLATIRAVVEPGALIESMRAGSDVWESQVVAAFYRLDRIEGRVNAGELPRDDEWTARHKEFHLALISGCGSERLVALCFGLFDQSERYRRLSASFRQKPRDTASEHRKLMEASLARDPVAAVLLRQHIDLTAKHLIAVLSEWQG